jgi:hypothetical protein
MGSIADLAGKRVYLDANVFIYALDNLPPWNIPATAILFGAEAGGFVACTSELALAECLVKPIQTGSHESVRVYQNAITPEAMVECSSGLSRGAGKGRRSSGYQCSQITRRDPYRILHTSARRCVHHQRPLG